MKNKIIFQIDTQPFGLPWWLSSKESAAMQQMQVWSLSQEDPWGKEMTTHSCTLAWDISWTEELADYSPQGCKRVGHGLAT